MSKLLIAQVATAVMVAGVRTIIQPGEEIPEQNAHDTEQLVAGRSATDVKAASASERADRRAQQSADDEFAAERRAVQAAQFSIDSDGSADQAHTSEGRPKRDKKA